MSKKRNIFEEIMEGIDSMKLHREGRITLRTYEMEAPEPLPEVTPEVIRETRERLNLSQAVFAKCLRISKRTLENWEQGRSRPNDQASTLILMVRQYPDTLSRLATLRG
jgi:putative transcriptional regulator